MLHRPTWSTTEPSIGPADRSMAVLQYFVAFVALAVAVALTFTR
jgi:hypothetical protein